MEIEGMRQPVGFTSSYFLNMEGKRTWLRNADGFWTLMCDA